MQIVHILETNDASLCKINRFGASELLNFSFAAGQSLQQAQCICLNNAM
jgi:hypothetical protein